MKRILITTVALLGFAGVAAAQQAPILNGNVAPNVENNFNADVSPDEGIDFNATSSVTNTQSMDSDMRWSEAQRFNDPEGGR